MMEFMQSWTFIIVMLIVLIGLIALFLYLRNQGADED
jgi:hypothetical protein